MHVIVLHVLLVVVFLCVFLHCIYIYKFKEIQCTRIFFWWFFDGVSKVVIFFCNYDESYDISITRKLQNKRPFTQNAFRIKLSKHTFQELNFLNVAAMLISVSCLKRCEMWLQWSKTSSTQKKGGNSTTEWKKWTAPKINILE